MNPRLDRPTLVEGLSEQRGKDQSLLEQTLNSCGAHRSDPKGLVTRRKDHQAPPEWPGVWAVTGLVLIPGQSTTQESSRIWVHKPILDRLVSICSSVLSSTGRLRHLAPGLVCVTPLHVGSSCKVGSALRQLWRNLALLERLHLLQRCREKAEQLSQQKAGFLAQDQRLRGVL